MNHAQHQTGSELAMKHLGRSFLPAFAVLSAFIVGILLAPVAQASHDEAVSPSVEQLVEANPSAMIHVIVAYDWRPGRFERSRIRHLKLQDL